ncbi:MAG TPA: universal stress protein [Acidimicrobiales bacterium]|nr:universal stress protein [Acidimicrobiales bacterium]
MTRIVVGIDGSDASRLALRWAWDEAALRGAELHVVHACTYPVVSGFGAVMPPLPAPGLILGEAERMVDQQLEEVLGEAAGDRVVREVVFGTASGVLVEASKGADLLVVGARGRGGFTGLLLGSVSQQCVHHARCPVVVLRTTD